MIGGNILAVLQVKDKEELNKIGEREHQWGDVTSLKGWLDLSDGTSNHTNFNAKIQESSHVFICDYVDLKKICPHITSENTQMVIDGNIYEVMLIDDPMEFHQHLEIFLRYVGGQYGSV